MCPTFSYFKVNICLINRGGQAVANSDQEQPSQETAVLPRVLVVASPPADGIKYSAEILIPGNWYDPTALVEGEQHSKTAFGVYLLILVTHLFLAL